MTELTLKWEKFGLSRGLHDMLGAGELVDVTLACQGQLIQAHKNVLAACSPHFRAMFRFNPCQHPIIFMQDVSLVHLQALLDFMYTGEATVDQQQLPIFLSIAEALNIDGLTNKHQEKRPYENKSVQNSTPVSSKRQRVNSLEVYDEVGSVSSCEQSSRMSADTSQPTVVPGSERTVLCEAPQQSVPEVIQLEAEEVTIDEVTNWQHAINQHAATQNFPGHSQAMSSQMKSAVLTPSRQQRKSTVLDGTYFKIVKVEGIKVWAQCQVCLPHEKILKGTWETTSNFKTHLIRMHPDRVSEYEEHMKHSTLKSVYASIEAAETERRLSTEKMMSPLNNVLSPNQMSSSNL